MASLLTRNRDSVYSGNEQPMKQKQYNQTEESEKVIRTYFHENFSPLSASLSSRSRL